MVGPRRTQDEDGFVLRGNRPFIGICAAPEPARWSFWDQDAVLVADTYLHAVRKAGGRPLLFSPERLEPGDAEDLLRRVDGVLLIGGADMDPQFYGADRSDRTERTVPVRDRFELAIVAAALRIDVPVLGICRGLQVMNVATGGTLHQHLLDHGFGEHRPASGRLDGPTRHRVTVERDSLVAHAGTLLVNSHHHQGIATVGKGGRVVARSQPDGVIEAIQWDAQRYALGVQWHPEAMAPGPVVAGLIRAAQTSTTDSALDNHTEAKNLPLATGA